MDTAEETPLVPKESTLKYKTKKKLVFRILTPLREGRGEKIVRRRGEEMGNCFALEYATEQLRVYLISRHLFKGKLLFSLMI